MVDTTKLSRAMRRLNRDLQKISKGLLEKGQTMDKTTGKVLTSAGNEMRNYIITSMRNTPRSAAFYRKGVNRSILHKPSMPGGFPAIDTGELVRSIMYDVGKFSLEIGSLGGGVYGKYLEEGTKNMAARPWLEPTADKFGDYILDKLREEYAKSIGSVFE